MCFGDTGMGLVIGLTIGCVVGAVLSLRSKYCE